MKRLMIAACCGLVLAPTAMAQTRHLADWGKRGELYDLNAPVLLKGNILQADFTGPTAGLSLVHSEPGKAPQQWAVDLGVTRTLQARNIDRATLTPGSPIIVRGYQAKDRSLRVAAVGANRADGRRTHTGNGAPRAGADW